MARYFWLKLKNTYFNQLTQKKMKRQPNGREMQIIYLRMLLSSLDKEGYIHYQGVYDSIEEELSEEFDEPPEIVKQTIEFLISNNMVTVDDKSSLFMPEAMENVGSIGDSGVRMQNLRNRRKTSQCDEGVTDSDEGVTQRREDTEKREETETETETETEDFPPGNANFPPGNTDISTGNSRAGQADAVSGDRPAGSAAADAAALQSDGLFSVKHLLAIAEKNKVNLTEEGIRVFHEEMCGTGWVLYDRPVEKSGIIKALRGWAKYHPGYNLDHCRSFAQYQAPGDTFLSSDESEEEELAGDDWWK